MAESDTELSRLKRAILDAVGENGQILIDFIPGLRRIIGPQPEPAPVGVVGSENRFNYLFQKFINAVVTPDRPLIIFLDDLQWVDLASLNLLKTLVVDPDSNNFLVIGAYRDNEVDSSHPLSLGLGPIKKTGAIVNQLTLDNLSSRRYQPVACRQLTQITFFLFALDSTP